MTYVSRTAPPPSKRSHDWLHFVARAEGGALDWVTRYRRLRPLADQSVDALHQMRKGQLEEGNQILQRYADALTDLPDTTPQSIRWVLDRWYDGTLGYYHYCRGDLDEARQAMDRANRAVVSAISRRRILLPLASHCHEFRLHHARIARNGRQWPRMWRAIDEAEAMVEDRLPLCVLDDGEEIFSSSLGDFYLGLGELAETEIRTVRDSWDLEVRRLRFRRFVRHLLTIDDFAILYP